MNPITISLSKPLQTHRGLVSELEMKAPTARSFIKHGEPFKTRFVGENVEFDFDNKACLGFLVDMTGIDHLILSDLSSVEYMKARNALVSMTLGILGENPTAPPAA